jgi:hypothetical protein
VTIFVGQIFVADVTIIMSRREESNFDYSFDAFVINGSMD